MDRDTVRKNRADRSLGLAVDSGVVELVATGGTGGVARKLISWGG
jgi:hypothetical protein